MRTRAPLVGFKSPIFIVSSRSPVVTICARALSTASGVRPKYCVSNGVRARVVPFSALELLNHRAGRITIASEAEAAHRIERFQDVNEIARANVVGEESPCRIPHAFAVHARGDVELVEKHRKYSRACLLRRLPLVVIRLNRRDRCGGHSRRASWRPQFHRCERLRDAVVVELKVGGLQIEQRSPTLVGDDDVDADADGGGRGDARDRRVARLARRIETLREDRGSRREDAEGRKHRCDSDSPCRQARSSKARSRRCDCTARDRFLRIHLPPRKEVSSDS